MECALSIGSDTGGSIRLPSAYCGVIGLKPTYGTVSRFGLVAFASSLDQIGPIARSAKDIAMFCNVLYGYDPKDSTSVNRKYSDFTENLGEDIKGKRIGLPKEYYGDNFPETIKNSVLSAAKEFEKMGAVVEETSLPLLE
jgi:aspartyl-tRNA(Asn)/glutamyl-tRNA(Gln) amidotransferase subunit A